MQLIKLGQLLEFFHSSFDQINNKPANLNQGVLLLIVEVCQNTPQTVTVEGHIAEILIDDKISVVLFDPEDKFCLEEILIPSQAFVLEIEPGKNARFVEFCGMMT